MVSSRDSFATDRVAVGVDAIVARERVEQQVRDGSDVISISVSDAACTETSGVESALTSLSASQEAKTTVVG